MCRRCGCLRPGNAGALRGAPVEGALEAAVLVACAETPRYGYEIAAWLAAGGLVTGPVSPGRLYETLGALTRQGMITAVGEPGHKGPSRRRYHLTAAGREHLAAWAASLQRTGAVLARLLTRMAALDAAAHVPAVGDQPPAHVKEEGEPMPCPCRCGDPPARSPEPPTGAPAPAPALARSVEERLETIESLLERLTAR